MATACPLAGFASEGNAERASGLPTGLARLSPPGSFSAAVPSMNTP